MAVKYVINGDSQVISQPLTDLFLDYSTISEWSHLRVYIGAVFTIDALNSSGFLFGLVKTRFGDDGTTESYANTPRDLLLSAQASYGDRFHQWVEIDRVWSPYSSQLMKIEIHSSIPPGSATVSTSAIAIG